RDDPECQVCLSLHDLFCLAASPAAHVYIAVCPARSFRVNIQTDMCFLFTAHYTASACNVEWNRSDVPFFDEFYISSHFNNFSRNFMPQHESFRRCRSASDHMLVTAANIRCNHF